MLTKKGLVQKVKHGYFRHDVLYEMMAGLDEIGKKIVSSEFCIPIPNIVQSPVKTWHKIMNF